MFLISLVNSRAEKYTKKLNTCVVKASCGYVRVFKCIIIIPKAKWNAASRTEARLSAHYPDERREPAAVAFQCCTMHTYTQSCTT